MKKIRKYHLLSLFFFTTTLFFYCKKEDGPASDDPIGLFNQAWEDFDRHYSYFVPKGIDWDEVGQRYREQVTDNTSSSELGKILGDMTLELRDIHVSVDKGTTHYTYRKRENYAANLPDFADKYLEPPIVNNNRLSLALVTDHPIVYFRLKTLGGEPSNYPEIQDMLDLLETKEHLILDLRDNGGGNEAVGRTIAKRLLANGSFVYRYTRRRNGAGWDDFDSWQASQLSSEDPINFSGQIILLTNRGCYSSTEGSILMFRTLPNVMILGDTTGGATANPEVFSLANGWKYRISCWQAADPNYQLIEDNGIVPDEVVMMTEASLLEQRDLMMERALDLLE